MIIFPIDHLPPVIPVGVQTSRGVMEIGFNVSRWLDQWPDMTFRVWVTRPTEAAAYPAEAEMEGSVLVWRVSDVDTAIKGLGKVEVAGESGEAKILSGPCTCEVRETSTASTQEPPDALEDWYTRLMAAFRAASLPETDTPHQQLVTDSDGAAMWAPRLAYEYQAETELLPATALTYGGEDGGYLVHILMTPLAQELEQGKTYTVTYNGAAYACPVVYVPAGQMGDEAAYILGKTSIVGLEGGNEDAPFVLLVSPGYEAQGYYAVCIALDNAESVTISITGKAAAIAKLPKAYYEQPDQSAGWNEEGYIKNRAFWKTELPDNQMVLDPAKLEEYESHVFGDEITAYKMSDVPLTKDTLSNLFGGAAVAVGTSADDFVLASESTVVQEDDFMFANVSKTGTLYGYLLATYEEGTSVMIGDTTFDGLTPGTWFLATQGTAPYVKVTSNAVGKWLDKSMGGMPKGSSDMPYLKWSEGQGWTKISLDQLKADLGLA